MLKPATRTNERLELLPAWLWAIQSLCSLSSPKKYQLPGPQEAFQSPLEITSAIWFGQEWLITSYHTKNGNFSDASGMLPKMNTCENRDPCVLVFAYRSASKVPEKVYTQRDHWVHHASLIQFCTPCSNQGMQLQTDKGDLRLEAYDSSPQWFLRNYFYNTPLNTVSKWLMNISSSCSQLMKKICLFHILRNWFVTGISYRLTVMITNVQTACHWSN